MCTRQSQEFASRSQEPCENERRPQQGFLREVANESDALDRRMLVDAHLEPCTSTFPQWHGVQAHSAAGRKLWHSERPISGSHRGWEMCGRGRTSRARAAWATSHFLGCLQRCRGLSAIRRRCGRIVDAQHCRCHSSVLLVGIAPQNCDAQMVRCRSSGLSCCSSCRLAEILRDLAPVALHALQGDHWGH